VVVPVLAGVVAVVCVVCVPGTPAPPELAPPGVVVPAAGEAAELPAPALPDDAADEPAPSVLVVVVFVVVVVDVDTVGGALFVGTVSVGEPAVFAWVELPPQAETPTASAMPAEKAATELARLVRRVDTSRASRPERVHATPAVRAIVQILLGELVAPIAEAEILDRPRELRRRRGQRDQHGDDFQCFARLPVQIGPAGLGLEHDFATCRRCPQPVLLIVSHRFDPTSGQETRHHRLRLG
jgi:hypothetical protein